MDKKDIIDMAAKHGWDLFKESIPTYELTFVKQGMKITVWYSKMTVGTCIDHPKKGKTQLFRKLVSKNLLNKLFENPRHHTGAGYYTK